MSAGFRTSILGVRDEAESLCEAIAADRGYRIVAVADDDGSAARGWAERFGAVAYTDCRTAIVEPQPDVLIVALPPHERAEYLQLATSRGIATLVTAPPTSTLLQASELAKLARQSAGSISVARGWQCEPAFVRLRGAEMLAGRPFSAHANVIAPLGDLQGWRGDVERAAGGVLLHDAYGQLDLLLSLFGMPEQVHAVVPRTTGPGEIRAHDTEDAVTLMMRFPGARVATMNCRRFGSEAYWRLRVHGAHATVLVTPDRMEISDAGNRPPSISRVRSRNHYAPVMAAFGAAVESGLVDSFSPIADHLMALAVVEAAYLSAKTGQPESPSRIYHITTGREIPI